MHAREFGLGDEFPCIEVDEMRVGHRAVLTLSGELDIATAETVQLAVDRVVEAGAAEIWIDFSRVAFMDSTGLRVLLTAHRQLRTRSRSLAIVCPPGPVRRVFTLAGLDQALAIYPDRAAAHAAG